MIYGDNKPPVTISLDFADLRQKIYAGRFLTTIYEVEVEGHVPFRRQTELLGKITLVMGQKSQLIWDLPPAETYALNRAVFAVPEDQYKATLAELDRPRIVVLRGGEGVGKSRLASWFVERAHEVAVAAFIARRLGFGGIADLVEATLDAADRRNATAEPKSIDEALAVDNMARSLAQDLVPEIAAKAI